MNKDELLKNIATTGYNVGFGAKKHFATYDIVSKTPGLISFFSMAFGIYALVLDGLSTKFLSATFIILGIVSLYISMYDSQKGEYESSGIKLTQYFNKLRDLYCRVKSAPCTDTSSFDQELSDIESEYYSSNISKQILFSDWYAHYKFFCQHQIEWIDEQKKFSLLRDKLPLTFSLTICAALIGGGIHVANWFSDGDKNIEQTSPAVTDACFLVTVTTFDTAGTRPQACERLEPQEQDPASLATQTTTGT
ncbi:SLATT domain-containing protein [Photobacterium sanguinicancri]|uniref:SLATT domain-containing protein n=1 Tax=Photobacterium sanguinicancri TaxID=875932 RepID=UPI00114062E0|nr:SLATT domain-containing protein [Photobacterium sanguinicancri]